MESHTISTLPSGIVHIFNGYATYKALEVIMKNTMNTNYRVMENMQDFDRIAAGNIAQYFEYEDYIIRIERVNNDYYGNPMYHVTISKDFENMTSILRGCSSVYRAYTKYGYCTVQSYSIGETVRNMVAYVSEATHK